MNELLEVASAISTLPSESLNFLRGYVAGVADGARSAGAGPAAGTADRGSFPVKMGRLGDLNESEKMKNLASKQGGTAR